MEYIIFGFFLTFNVLLICDLKRLRLHDENNYNEDQ